MLSYATQVPFRGGSRARAALIAEKVDFAFLSFSSAKGTVRILQVIKDTNPVCAYVHIDTPKDIVEQLRQKVLSTANNPRFVSRTTKANIMPVYRSHEESQKVLGAL